MLAELYRAVANVGFEVYFVVAVVLEGYPEVADVVCASNISFAYCGKALAVGVVASAAWHEVVDNTLKAFIG